MVLFSHTIGLVWLGGQHKEPELLADCYRNLLQVWRRLQNAYTLHWQMLADEMLAIKGEIDAWRAKKEAEEAQTSYNARLYYKNWEPDEED